MDEFWTGFALEDETPVQTRPNWGLRGPEEFVREAFWIWYQTDFRVLPFAGGWFDQPEWIRDDLKHSLWGVRYHRQRIKQPEKPKPFKDLLKS